MAKTGIYVYKIFPNWCFSALHDHVNPKVGIHIYLVLTVWHEGLHSKIKVGQDSGLIMPWKVGFLKKLENWKVGTNFLLKSQNSQVFTLSVSLVPTSTLNSMLSLLQPRQDPNWTVVNGGSTTQSLTSWKFDLEELMKFRARMAIIDEIRIFDCIISEAENMPIHLDFHKPYYILYIWTRRFNICFALS